MKLEAIAKAYIDCIELEDRALQEASGLSEDLGILRADLHALLMDALRQANIPFTDRSHAAQLAYGIVQKKQKTA
jgi:hypothetical protein